MSEQSNDPVDEMRTILEQLVEERGHGPVSSDVYAQARDAMARYDESRKAAPQNLRDLQETAGRITEQLAKIKSLAVDPEPIRQYISQLKTERDEATKRAERLFQNLCASTWRETKLRTGLETVEWVLTNNGWRKCPWCLNYIEQGHKFDCVRQLALATDSDAPAQTAAEEKDVKTEAKNRLASALAHASVTMSPWEVREVLYHGGYQICSKCGRKTWSESEFNNRCGMMQPGGEKCVGRFQ